eukprot:1558825-Rhodomonas_salina.2
MVQACRARGPQGGGPVRSGLQTVAQTDGTELRLHGQRGHSQQEDCTISAVTVAQSAAVLPRGSLSFCGSEDDRQTLWLPGPRVFTVPKDPMHSKLH